MSVVCSTEFAGDSALLNPGDAELALGAWMGFRRQGTGSSQQFSAYISYIVVSTCGRNLASLTRVARG